MHSADFEYFGLKLMFDSAPETTPTPVAKEFEAVLAARFQRPLLLYFRANWSDWHSAEDLVQDTLGTVIRKLREAPLRDAEKLKAYVFATARYVLANRRRDSNRHGDETGAVSLESEPDLLPASPAENPQAQAESDQLGQIIRTLIDSLEQTRDQDILRDYYLNQIDKETLLLRYRMNPAQFDNALYRARSRLRELLLRWGWPQ